MATQAKQSNKAQTALWNARASEVWVTQQTLLDRLFLPFEELLAHKVRESGAANLLDIGCGAGATTIAAANAIAGRGQCTGLDISAPLIELARSRARNEDIGNVDFIAGDAQTYELPVAGVDAIISRFGIMFFDDPLAAFANLRGAVCAGGSLMAIVWRSADENPFMTAAEQAAAPFIPELTPRTSTEPGQFALADPRRVRTFLEPHWSQVDIKALDVDCSLRQQDLEAYILNMGRVGLLLPGLEPEAQMRVIAALRQAFEPFLRDGAARFTAACWLVQAKA